MTSIADVAQPRWHHVIRFFSRFGRNTNRRTTGYSLPRSPRYQIGDHFAPGELGAEIPVQICTASCELSDVMKDFTPGEVVMFLPTPVAEGGLVTVRFDNFAFDGEVLLCRQTAGEYKIHVSIKD